MSAQDYKIRVAALSLGRFTAKELVALSRSPDETVNSWIKRESKKTDGLLQRETGSEQSGSGAEPVPRGRPANIWRVRPDAAQQLKQSLQQVFPQLMREHGMGAEFDLPSLARAEQDLDRCVTARATNDQELETDLLASAQAWLRVAWERLSELSTAQIEIPASVIHRLAVAEQNADFHTRLTIPHDLPRCVEVLERFFVESSEAGLSSRFAARRLWAHIQLRPPPDAAMALAASLAALVWRDRSDWSAAPRDGFAQICAAATPEELASHLSIFLQNISGPYAPKDSLEAIMYGIARFPRFTVSHAIQNWLTKLIASTDWSYRLAPIVLYLLGDAPSIHLPQLLARLQTDLGRALEEWRSGSSPGWRKAAGIKCFEYATRLCRQDMPNEPSAAAVVKFLAVA